MASPQKSPAMCPAAVQVRHAHYAAHLAIGEDMTYRHVTRLLATTTLLSSTAVVALVSGSGTAVQAAATCSLADTFRAQTLRPSTPTADRKFGFPAVTGDFNKDGYSDMAIGGSGGPSSGGVVYFFK